MDSSLYSSCSAIYVLYSGLCSLLIMDCVFTLYSDFQHPTNVEVSEKTMVSRGYKYGAAQAVIDKIECSRAKRTEDEEQEELDEILKRIRLVRTNIIIIINLL